MKTLNYQVKIILSLCIAVLFVFGACKKEEDPPQPVPTTLNLSITDHPVGGNKISEVSAKFEGTIGGEVTTISVTVEWWWEDGNHANAKMMDSEELIFNSSNVTKKSTIYKAAVGYVFMNYYWVKLSWTDDSGQHNKESSKAYCTNQ